jgi:hypothetical protein
MDGNNITKEIKNLDIKDLDINEIFEEVISLHNPTPNSYPLEFEIDSLKELFEFLLQFVTMLCKYFYGNEIGQVDLSTLSQNDFIKIDNYMKCIGFSCNFQGLSANNYNINYVYDNKYDRVNITPQTKLKDLLFGIKCNTMLYVISFDTFVLV